MLLGRGLETARIGRALADARDGTSSVLVVRGEAGIGKTALLRYAVEEAEGMRVLSARGVQFEADVPFAGLHELLRPALEALGRLPPVHARALSAALGLGERVISDRLVIGAATLELLTAWAETPLLVVLDDSQWLDRASAEAIAFAARRLLADPVAVVVAVRDGEESPLLGAGLPEVRLGGLGEDDAGTLLRTAAAGPLGDDVARRILDATAGNPLALLEMAAQAHLFEGASTYAPLPVSTSVERSYLRRAVGMSPAGRTALLLVAASGAADLELVRRAAAALELPADAVEEAEESAGLVALRDRSLEFVHPLARAALYHAASPADRRAAHRALAAVTVAPEAADRRAWHLAAAAAGPDEAAAAELAAAGMRARARTGHVTAAAAFQEAARLTADDGARARRLFAAADSAWLAGQAERAAALLAEARDCAGDERLRVEIEALAGHIALRQGATADGYRMVLSAASTLAATDHRQAIHLLADSSLIGFGSGRMADMLATGRRAFELLRPDDPPTTAIWAHTAYGAALVLAGRGGAEGPDHLRAAAGLFGRGDDAEHDPLLMICAGVAGLYLREAETGRDLRERALADARRHAPAAALPAVLFYLGRDAATTDRWAAARGYYEEGARLARETNQFTWVVALVAGLAQLDAHEGRGTELAAHAAEIESLADRYQMENYRAWLAAAQALHELGAGRAAPALRHLLRLRRIYRDLGIEDPDVDPAPDLAEVHLRLGDADTAVAEATAYRAAAEAKGQPFALARACRALGMVAAEDAFAAHFETALEHHAGTPDTFETARTRLAYGERLRRARRRGIARQHLADALEAFDRLGAVPWSRRALVELGASGESSRRRDDGARHRLTPQEVQIALALAEGYTTREAAAKLFLSPKTVEYHLRNVYDKLDVRSRDELRSVMSGARPTRRA